MDTSQTIVLIGGALLMLFTLWFFFGERLRERKTKDRSTNDGATTTAPLYACPMHSWITSEKPGESCSICGMQLVLQEA